MQKMYDLLWVQIFAMVSIYLTQKHCLHLLWRQYDIGSFQE